MTPKPPRPAKGYTVRMLELAARPEGVDNRDLREACGVHSDTASGLLGSGVTRYGFVRVYTPGRYARYFATQAAADAWRASALCSPEKPKQRPVTMVRKALPAPVVISDRKAGGEVDYSRAKLTVAPRVVGDIRYQVQPGERVFGAGFSAIGIGRDVQTGRGWEA